MIGFVNNFAARAAQTSVLTTAITAAGLGTTAFAVTGCDPLGCNIEFPVVPVESGTDTDATGSTGFSSSTTGSTSTGLDTTTGFTTSTSGATDSSSSSSGTAADSTSSSSGATESSSSSSSTAADSTSSSSGAADSTGAVDVTGETAYYFIPDSYTLENPYERYLKEQEDRKSKSSTPTPTIPMLWRGIPA